MLNDIKTLANKLTVRPVWIISGLAIMIFVAGIVLGFTFSTKTVYFVQDGHQVKMKTRSSSVGEFLKENNIVLGPDKAVIPEAATPIEDDMVVEIRDKHNIVLIADNNKLEFKSLARTVGEVLAEKKLVLGDEDIVVPGVEQEITKDLEIRVTRVVKKTEEKKVAIPYSTKTIKDPGIQRGITKTVTAGRNGEELQKWVVIYHDGREKARQLIEKQVISPPKDAVVHVGTGANVVSRGGQTFRYRQVMDVYASAYTYTGNNTASEVPPSYGVVAVDPRVIPLGTRLYVEGYGFATALDTGGSIRGNRIDVFQETYNAARSWGVRKVRVYILE